MRYVGIGCLIVALPTFFCVWPISLFLVLIGVLLIGFDAVVETNRPRKYSAVGRSSHARYHTDAPHPESWLPPSPGEPVRPQNPADPLDFLNDV